MVAAVQALMTLPTPGIHPISTCEAVRPIVAAAADANVAVAVLSLNSMLKTLPRAIVIVSCTGVMMALSLHGIWASPAPTAPADMLAECMMAWHLPR